MQFDGLNQYIPLRLLHYHSEARSPKGIRIAVVNNFLVSLGGNARYLVGLRISIISVKFAFAHGCSPFYSMEGEGLCPLREVGEKRGAFALEADFFRSAVFMALSRCRSEQTNKLDILRAAHDVGDAVVRSIDEFGYRIGGEVGEQVKPLADRSACALDLVGQAIRAEVVGEVVGFGEVARQGEAHGLFGVLPVVAVVVEVGKSEGFHSSLLLCLPLWGLFFEVTSL